MSLRLYGSPLLRRGACACTAKNARLFSTSQRLYKLPDDIPKPAPPADKGWAHLSNRTLIEVIGEDSTNWLQGLVMQDLIPQQNESQDPERMYYTAMLNVRGRINWDLFAFRFIKKMENGPRAGATFVGYYLDMDASEWPSIRKELVKRKLRSKFKFREVPQSTLSVYAAWNTPVSKIWETTSWTPPKRNFPVPDLGLPNTYIDPRAPRFGYRIIAPPKLMEQRAKHLGEKASLMQYAIRRYMCGIPEGIGEVHHDSAMPMETNFDLCDGISFTKGCYIGQELTHRTRHQGVIRKRILPIQISATEDDVKLVNTVPEYDPDFKHSPPTPGAKLVIKDTIAGRRVGQFIRGFSNVGLALCQLPAMTDIKIIGTANRYDPTRPFVAMDSQGAATLKTIHPFVPPWLRTFINKEQEKRLNPVEGKVRFIGKEKKE